jgi:hypothetical protein
MELKGIEVLYEAPPQLKGIELEVDTRPYQPNGPCYDSPICEEGE